MKSMVLWTSWDLRSISTKFPNDSSHKAQPPYSGYSCHISTKTCGFALVPPHLRHHALSDRSKRQQGPRPPHDNPFPTPGKTHKVRMCKACEVTFQRHITSTPTSYSEYTSECLAETAKVGNWLLAQGYCQDSYTFPICDNEAFDPVGAVLEGPKLGVARSFRLQELGSRQTDRTDFKHRASSSASGGGECRCTQGPEVCSCRDNAWAQRRGG